MLITHDMGVIAETADRVAVMYAGRLAEIGPVGDVIHRPRHPYTEGLMGSRSRRSMVHAGAGARSTAHARAPERQFRQGAPSTRAAGPAATALQRNEPGDGRRRLAGSILALRDAREAA